MAIGVNGYNDTFKAFADFARVMVTVEGNENSIARISQGVDVSRGALAGRTITASSTDSVRGLFKWFRSADDKAANNAAREMFRNAINEMFGGESKIPESVKKAMILADYGKGKPLTARRILAVKAAIEGDSAIQSTIRARARQLSIAKEVFNSPEVMDKARELGYTKADIPRLARAAHLYAQAKGVDEMEAMKAVAEPNSKANRLMQYGGRFLDNAENFANGLRLIDSFKSWFTQVRDKKNANGEPTSATDFNISSEVIVHDSSAAFERFVFEELAINDGHNLNETDPEELFGVKNNAAMRFFATDRCFHFVGVVANVPPEKRGTIYAVLDKLTIPIAETKEESIRQQGMRQRERGVQNQHLVIGRILRHMPEMEKMAASGTLTEANIVKTLFPDIPSKDWTRASMNEYTRNLVDIISERLMAEGIAKGNEANVAGKVIGIMEDSCCTLKEGIDAYKTGKRIAPPQYMTPATFSIEKLDGTTAAARELLDGKGAGDLWRAYNYAPSNDAENEEAFYIKDADKLAFSFTFPDGTTLKSNAGVHSGNIPKILDKLEDLAGKVHPRQQSALMFAVSQAGTGQLKGGLMAHGIASSEHAAVNFTLVKDDSTGAITVKYTSPKELPVSFSWTTTIDVDGNTTTTPLVVETAVERLGSKAAGDLVDGAVKNLGATLTGAQRKEAVNLLKQYGTNMLPGNAKLFAQFLVNLVGKSLGAERNAAMSRETAASIREWRDFSYGDKDMDQLANAIKDHANQTIRDFMKPESAGKFNDNIHTTMIADAGRGTFILNGKTYPYKPAGELIPEFKKIVPDPKNQKALSCWMNQLCMTTVLMPSNYLPLETGVEAHKLPGAGKLVNRDLTSGTFQDQLINPYGHNVVQDLKISPDGKTATITQTTIAGLSSPGAERNENLNFGHVMLSQRLVIDLTQEIPNVTDFQLSQTIIP